MNVAIILAGGTGSRMGANIPKQFLRVMGKPILAYTLEIFQNNSNIDAIEIVCHEDWVNETRYICRNYGITKMQWIVRGGRTFQDSVMKGVYNLKDKLDINDIVVISFGVSPMTTDDIINDSINICINSGSNAIASEDMVLCTCIKDDEFSTTKSILRETLKGFSNPWTFKYGELYEVYKEAESKRMLETIEPHTTSLYLALGKRLYFSKTNSLNIKITTPEDLEIFEGHLLLLQKRAKFGMKEEM